MRKSFKAHCRLAGAWESVPAELQAEWQAHLAKSFPYSQGAAAVAEHKAEKERLETALAPWSMYDRKRGEHGRRVLCDFEFTDPYLFDQHMADVHGKKPSSVKGEAETLVKAIRRMWHGPRLTDDGKPFEPTDLEPGAVVTWRELVPTGESYTESTPEHGTREVVVREWVERSGQVWSAASYPKSAWVVPFELREGELAVCVRRSSLSDRLEHSATWTADGYRDAA